MTDREFRSILKPVREERFPIGFLALVRQSHSKKLRFFPSSFQIQTISKQQARRRFVMRAMTKETYEGSCLKGKNMPSFKREAEIWSQFFQEKYPDIHKRVCWEVNQQSLEDLLALDLGEEKGFWRLTVVPNLLQAFGETQDPVFLDLRFADIFLSYFCKISGINFSNFCLMKKEILFKRGDGWDNFYQVCREQGTGLVAILVQYGYVRPCNGNDLCSLLSFPSEFHVPFGLEALIVSSSGPQVVWGGIHERRVIASAGSRASTGFGIDGRYPYPCLDYCVLANDLAALSVSEALALETDDKRRHEKEQRIGFMTAIASA